MINKFIYTIVFFIISSNVKANERIIDLFTPLKKTPSVLIVDNISKPNDFYKGNNLTRRPGSFYKAKGVPLYVKGKITDAFGVPIYNAIIKIWQTNAAGKYQNIIEPKNRYYDKEFLMSGQSSTNNLGNYIFVTIFPGFYEDRAPHINMIIMHEKFGTLETEFYFKDHKRNAKDPIYMAYPKEDRKDLTVETYYVDDNDPSQGIIAEFNIIFDGVHEYKRY